MFYVKLVIIYVIIWWVLFFMALPFGIKQSSKIIPGQDLGAPEKPRLWIKFFIVSIVAFIATMMAHLIITYNLLNINVK